MGQRNVLRLQISKFNHPKETLKSTLHLCHSKLTVVLNDKARLSHEKERKVNAAQNASITYKNQKNNMRQKATFIQKYCNRGMLVVNSKLFKFVHQYIYLLSQCLQFISKVTGEPCRALKL